MRGKLIVFAAPSGSGKTTLVRYLLSQIENLSFSVSATTRDKRPNEIDGKHYHFISREDFVARRTESEFLEWQEVYDGNYYGTLKSEVNRLLEEGKNVIFDVDVKGALNIKNYYREDALAVFVAVPSINHLRERLLKRKTETEKTLAKRLAKAALEISYAEKFDVSVMNDDMEHAKANALKLAENFLPNDDRYAIMTYAHSYVAETV
ncbi:MAG: guanylate kinase [Chitinophagales bacterium]